VAIRFDIRRVPANAEKRCVRTALACAGRGQSGNTSEPSGSVGSGVAKRQRDNRTREGRRQRQQVQRLDSTQRNCFPCMCRPRQSHAACRLLWRMGVFYVLKSRGRPFIQPSFFVPSPPPLSLSPSLQSVQSLPCPLCPQKFAIDITTVVFVNSGGR